MTTLAVDPAELRPGPPDNERACRLLHRYARTQLTQFGVSG